MENERNGETSTASDEEDFNELPPAHVDLVRAETTVQNDRDFRHAQQLEWNLKDRRLNGGEDAPPPRNDVDLWASDNEASANESEAQEEVVEEVVREASPPPVVIERPAKETKARNNEWDDDSGSESVDIGNNAYDPWNLDDKPQQVSNVAESSEVETANETPIQRSLPTHQTRADENLNAAHHSNSQRQWSNDVRSSDHGGEHSNFESRRQERMCYNCHQLGHLSRHCPEKQSGERHNQRDSQHSGRHSTPRNNRPNSSNDNWNQPSVRQRKSNGLRKGNNTQKQSFPNRLPCIPVQRTVDQIFQDDQENEVDQQFLYDSDGGVIVVYGPDDMPVIDTWDEAELLPEVLENIKRAQYVRPRNIQRYALPLIWQGYDLKAQAETGSGKSAGFLVPIIDKLAREFKGKDPNDRLHLVSALVVVPTRELAIQLSEQGRKLADGTGVRVNSAYGEYKVQNNVESIHLNGCDILVATLGRLLNFMRNKVIVYDKLKYFVLDEVDALLSPDCMDSVQQVCAFDGFPTVSERQTLCFSATMSPAVRQLADQFCKPKSPIIRNKIKDLNQRVTVEIVEVPFAERNQYLMDYLRGEAEKNDGILPKKLIFVEKKRDVDELVEQLQELHIPIQAIHGERSQQQREEINRAFREGKIRALVATELFARGLDIADLGHVINVHMPSTREKFVHRIGRTGRTHSGVASVYFDPNHAEDREMSGTIIEVLTKLKLDVPQFVRNANDQIIS
ncbi:hypothetical protein M3Y94_01303800 [Aphelenchoides besseyi]|nr:hypothetical protein M3Y94_01303800 [Aphelenchoides besseyi]KAI6220205.1 hypothetical protein M3Y95_01060200 [Aphelenchoides besseyi]